MKNRREEGFLKPIATYFYFDGGIKMSSDTLLHFKLLLVLQANELSYAGKLLKPNL